MSQRAYRKLVVGLVMMTFAIVPGGCLTTDSVSSLVDLASSTTGSLVEILTKGGLVNFITPSGQNPDLTAPISDQVH